MAKVKLVRGRPSVTHRNARYYVHKSVPYISLALSLAALLKAYNVLV